MIQVNVGFRIRTKISRPAPEVVNVFKQTGAANVTDAQNRAGTLHYSVKPIIPAKEYPVVGTAVTVRARAGDNLMITKAIMMCQPGDVLIVAAPHGGDNALWGGVLSTLAAKRGIVALVTDGYVRDIAEMRRAGLPVWAAGVLPTGPSADGKGEINTTISCGGVVVNPGDIVVADEDGVVVVAQEHAVKVGQRALEVVERDATWIREIEAEGVFASIKRLDTVLADKGVVIED